jgi:hypothetical protein
MEMPTPATTERLALGLEEASHMTDWLEIPVGGGALFCLPGAKRRRKTACRRATRRRTRGGGTAGRGRKVR